MSGVWIPPRGGIEIALNKGTAVRFSAGVSFGAAGEESSQSLRVGTALVFGLGEPRNP